MMRNRNFVLNLILLLLAIDLSALAQDNTDFDMYKQVVDHAKKSSLVKNKIKKTFGRKALKFKVSNQIIENDSLDSSVDKNKKNIVDGLTSLSINKSSKYTFFVSNIVAHKMCAAIQWTGNDSTYERFGKVLILYFTFNHDNKIISESFVVKIYE